MKSLEVQNNQTFEINSIPFYNKENFYDIVKSYIETGSRMCALTPIDSSNPRKITAILLNKNSSKIEIIGGDFTEEKLEIESWANEYPHTNYYECELAENNNYNILNHPWQRPVRNQNYLINKKPYSFFKIEGEEIHEVAVGPIHAGVIEPGHFRFQCHGEMVYNLEINLGYQHRGIEKMMLNSNSNQRIILSESIAGDTVISNSFAHCQIIENLTNTQISLRANSIRVIAAEIERVAMHLSGLSGIANDIGFALPASSYGRLRTLAINSLLVLCGSRFGRGLFVYGGTRFDFNDEIIDKILENLNVIQNDVEEINKYLFSSIGALSRLEETGSIDKDLAIKIGIIGLAARACGIEEDVRIQFPYSIYKYNPTTMITLPTCDVYARTRLRSIELNESIKLIKDLISTLPTEKVKNNIGEDVKPNSGIVSALEGWRGEIIHIAFTDSEGKLIQYKIKDPSFNNWYGLSLALRETGISDFPLCNKSFDLSYSGHDL